MRTLYIGGAADNDQREMRGGAITAAVTYRPLTDFPSDPMLVHSYFSRDFVVLPKDATREEVLRVFIWDQWRGEDVVPTIETRLWVRVVRQVSSRNLR